LAGETYTLTVPIAAPMLYTIALMTAEDDRAMGDLTKIKESVEQLAPQQLAEFRDWFVEHDAILWDEQIARDLADGKLDALIARARADRAAGKVTDL
jgi:hypothetical protein